MNSEDGKTFGLNFLYEDGIFEKAISKSQGYVEEFKNLFKNNEEQIEQPIQETISDIVQNAIENGTEQGISNANINTDEIDDDDWFSEMFPDFSEEAGNIVAENITEGNDDLIDSNNGLSESAEHASHSVEELTVNETAQGVAAQDSSKQTTVAGNAIQALGIKAKLGSIGLGLLNAALNAGIIWLVTTAIQLLVKGLDALIITAKEAKESMKDSLESYSDANQKVEELNKNLQTTVDRINELNSKDSLTLIEESELNKLKESKKLLEQQVKLAEFNRKKEARSGMAAAHQAFIRNFDTNTTVSSMDAGGYTSGFEDAYNPNGEYRFVDYENTSMRNGNIYENQIKKYIEAKKALDNASIDSSDASAEAYENLKSSFDDEDSKLNEYLGELLEWQIDYTTFIENAKESGEEISDDVIKEYEQLNNWIDLIQKAQSNQIDLEILPIESFFSKNKVIKDYLMDIAKSGGNAAEALHQYGIVIDDVSDDTLKRYFEEQVNGITEVSNAFEDARNIYSDYIKEIQEAKSKGITDFTQTQFGNIDLGKDRGRITWNPRNQSYYKDALESWGFDFTSQDYSTVLGDVEKFEGVDIAFTPLLQTSKGGELELLDSDTVYKYLDRVIGKAIREGGDDWQKLVMEIDSKGLLVEGKKIKNLIADIGDTAKSTSEQMHYLGEDGSVPSLFKELKRTADECGISIEQLLVALDKLEAKYDGTLKSVETAFETKNSSADWDKLTDFNTKIKDIYGSGQVGTDDFKSFVEMMSPDIVSGKNLEDFKYDAQAYIEAYKDMVDEMNKYFNDENPLESVQYAIKKLKDAGLAEVTKGEEFDIVDFTSQFQSSADAAKAFGMSIESTEILLNQMKDYGIEFGEGFIFAGEQVSQYSTALNGIKDNINQIKQNINDESEYGTFVESMFGDWNSVYAAAEADMTTLTEDKVIQIQFEYDISKIQQDLTDATHNYEYNENAENLAALLMTQEDAINSYQKAFEKQGIEIPIIGNTEQLRQDLSNAKTDEERKEWLLKLKVDNENIIEIFEKYREWAVQLQLEDVNADISFDAFVKEHQNMTIYTDANTNPAYSTVNNLLSWISSLRPVIDVLVRTIGIKNERQQEANELSKNQNRTNSAKKEIETKSKQGISIPGGPFISQNSSKKAQVNNANVIAANKAQAQADKIIEDAQAQADNIVQNALNNGGGVVKQNNTSPSYLKDKDKGSGGGGGSSDKDKEKDKQKFDWIEVAISRIERAIDKLKTAANRTWKSWTDRASGLNGAIAKTKEEIALQQQALIRYQQEADKIALSEEYKQKVRFGLIDIESIEDEDLRKLIEEFQTANDKVLATEDAMEQLNDQLVELRKQEFDNVLSQFEAMAGLADSIWSTNDTRWDSYNSGRNFTTNGDINTYYDSKNNYLRDQLNLAKQEASELQSTLDGLVSDGTITEYSEDWYTMTSQIQDAKNKVIEYETEIADNVYNSLKEQFQNLADQYNNMFDELERRWSKIETQWDARQDRTFITNDDISNYYGLRNSFLKGEAKNAQDEVDALRGKLNEMMSRGGLKEFSDDWYDLVGQIEDAENAVAEYNAEIEKNKAASLMEQFNNIQNAFDMNTGQLENALNDIQTLQDTAEIKGYTATKNWYAEMQRLEQQNMAQLQQEYKMLSDSLTTALNSGAIKEYSNDWYEMKQSINSVRSAIYDVSKALAEYEKQMRQIDWDFFDTTEDYISDIAEEANFMINLLTTEHKLIEENGDFNNYGTSVSGLHVINYKTYVRQAEQYANEIKKIDKQINQTPYDTTLIERRRELLKVQRDMISAAEDEKEALRSLAKEGYDNFLSYLQKLINKRKEALQAEKNMYDYEKTVREQTETVTTLQKQLISIQGDNSEEGKNRLQSVLEDLKNAEAQLEETEYNQWLSDQQMMLDKLYDEFELLINERLDNINSAIHDLVIQVGASSGTIAETINTSADNVDYSLRSGLNIVLSEMQNRGDMRESQLEQLRTETLMSMDILGLNTFNGLQTINGSVSAGISAITNNQNTLRENAIQNASNIIGSVNAGTSSINLQTYTSTHSMITKLTDIEGQQARQASALQDVATTLSNFYSSYTNAQNAKSSDSLSSSSSSNGPIYQINESGERGNYRVGTYEQLFGGAGYQSTSSGSSSSRIIQINDSGSSANYRHVSYSEGGTVGKAIHAAGEDGWALLRTGEEVLSLEKVKELQGALSILDNISSNVGTFNPVHMSNNSNINSNQNITMEINLPNVTNPQNFVDFLQSDKAQAIIKQSTLGAALGQSKMKRFTV